MSHKDKLNGIVFKLRYVQSKADTVTNKDEVIAGLHAAINGAVDDLHEVMGDMAIERIRECKPFMREDETKPSAAVVSNLRRHIQTGESK